MPLLLPLLTKQVIHVRAGTLLRQLDEGSVALPESLRLPMDVVSSFSLAASGQVPHAAEMGQRSAARASPSHKPSLSSRKAVAEVQT